MGRRKDDVGTLLIDLGAAVPWWICLALAAGTYLLFHSFATIETGAGTSSDIAQVMPRQFIKTGSSILQYIVPLLFVIGAIVGLFRRRWRARPFDPVANGNTRNLVPGSSPFCPSCGSQMLLRAAKRGTNAGSRFWGCSHYPGCRGTRQFS